jgi:hypothetical protein
MKRHKKKKRVTSSLATISWMIYFIFTIFMHELFFFFKKKSTTRYPYHVYLFTLHAIHSVYRSNNNTKVTMER